jgi:hypothetical protein
VDFFRAQDAATKRSRFLVVAFAAAVATIIAAIYGIAHLTLGPGPGGAFDPELFVVVAVLTGGLIAGGSAWRTSQLRAGGHTVARAQGLSRDLAEVVHRRHA